MEIFAKPRNKPQFQRRTKVKFYFDAKAENVRANRIQVQQLLVNLLRNANDAMTEDRYDLEVRTALLDNEMVEIAVADRGPGLLAEIASTFRGISIHQTGWHGARSHDLPIDRRSPRRQAPVSRIPEVEQSFALPCPLSRK
jgi:hypothetical protein